MRWPINLIGIIFLALGGAIVINPDVVRRIIDYIDGIKARLYTVGVLRLIMGSLLIASAGNARLYGFIMTLGILIVLGGVCIFTLPYANLTKMLAWYRERSLLTYRILGIAVLILGSVLLFAC